MKNQRKVGFSTIFVIIIFSLGVYFLQVIEKNAEAEVSYDARAFTIKVDEGEIEPIDLKLSNSGDTTLLISDISSSCGCLTPDVEDILIQPGQAVSIPLTFRDIDGKGERVYNVAARTNDPKNPTIMFRIEANVFNDIDLLFEHGFLFLKNQSYDEDQLTIKLNTENQTIRDVTIDSSVPWLNIDMVSSIVAHISAIDGVPYGQTDVKIYTTLNKKAKLS